MLLKALGWAIAPFIMVLIRWKKMKGYSKVIGLAWCFIFIIVMIAANSDPAVEAQKNVAVVAATDQTMLEESVESTEEQWQTSYKQIALNEASAYLELSAAQSLSDERLSYAVQTLKTQAANIDEADKEKFVDLAAFVEQNNYESAKEQYLLLGGNKSIFHD